MAMNPVLKQLLSQNANKYKAGNAGKAQKPKEGRNNIRLIAPSPQEAGWIGDDFRFHRDLGVHWIKAGENQKPVAVVGSQEICYDRISPISAAVEMAVAQAYDEESKKLYESWRARPSVLVNVVNRDNKDEVEVWELTRTVWGKINDLAMLYADQQDYNIFDHTVGMDFVITKTGKGLNTEYDVAVSPMIPGQSFKPVTAEQVAKATNLDDFIKSNYFREDETKALNAVAQLAGVMVPAIGAPSTPTAALTSQSATVANVASAPLTVVPAAPAVDPAVLAAQQAAQAAALAAQLAATQAAVVTPAAPIVAAQPVVAPAVAETPATVVIDANTAFSSMPADAQADLMAQLNAIQ